MKFLKVIFGVFVTLLILVFNDLIQQTATNGVQAAAALTSIIAVLVIWVSLLEAPRTQPYNLTKEWEDICNNTAAHFRESHTTETSSQGGERHLPSGSNYTKEASNAPSKSELGGNWDRDHDYRGDGSGGDSYKDTCGYGS